MRLHAVIPVLLLLGCRAEPFAHTAQSARTLCEDTSCMEDGPPTPPPDAPPPPLTGCDERAGTVLDLALLAARMLAAATCVGVNGGEMNGYGCFCGSGNTGLNTKPVDALDGCCQQHDVDWHAICQNTPETPGSTKGCNCYMNTPAVTCTAGVISFAPGLNACQQACANELKTNSECMATNKAAWDEDYWQGDPTIKTPFAGDCPDYCKAGGPPPGSTFGPVKLPDNQNYPTCKPVAAEDLPPDLR